MRKYLLLSFFICILILLLSSCITTKRYKNDWMNKKYTTKECTHDNDIIELPYILVPDSEKEKYVALLKDVSLCEIDKTEYEMIAGKACEKKYTIAVRAVYTNLGGSFYVAYIKSDLEIVVDYCVLGRVYGVHKTVLFIEVDNLPRYVYVNYSGAI